jgi:tRNA (cmo5U34)-methyltransferase
VTPSGRQEWSDPASARRWDASHLEGNPTRAVHLELLLELLAQEGPRRVLDLGCGSGLVAEMALERLPGAELWGLDASDPMLELARGRLARFGTRAHLVRADFTRLDGVEVPACEAAVAVQSLHHVGRRQAHAYAWLRERLRPGSLLVLVERVAVPAASLYEAFHLVKHREGHARNPASWEEYHADLVAGGDRPLTLAELTGMLEQAGFESGCLDVRADRALLVARRSG